MIGLRVFRTKQESTKALEKVLHFNLKLCADDVAKCKRSLTLRISGEICACFSKRSWSCVEFYDVACMLGVANINYVVNIYYLSCLFALNFFPAQFSRVYFVLAKFLVIFCFRWCCWRCLRIVILRNVFFSLNFLCIHLVFIFFIHFRELFEVNWFIISKLTNSQVLSLNGFHSVTLDFNLLFTYSSQF